MSTVIGSIRNALVPSRRINSTVPRQPGSNNTINALFGSFGDKRLLETPEKVSTLYSALQVRGTSLAQVPFHLYDVQGGDNRRGKLPRTDWTEVFDHPFLELWEMPNTFMDRAYFMEALQQHLDLTGKFYVFKDVIQGNSIAQLWPIRPDVISPIRDTRTFSSGFIQQVDGVVTRYSLDQVSWVRHPDPSDVYECLGPVESLMIDLLNSRQISAWNYAFFRNSALPTGVIEVDPTVQQGELDEVIESWDDQHGGVSNAHRVAFIRGGKWSNRTFTMRDMQFIEQRKDVRDTILEGLRVSKTMLGQADGATNRSTAETAEYVFAKYFMRGALQKFATWINTDLLKVFDPTGKYCFEFDDPAKEDPMVAIAERDSQVDNAIKLIGVNVVREEALEAMGLPPMNFEELTQLPPVGNGSGAPDPELEDTDEDA